MHLRTLSPLRLLVFPLLVLLALFAGTPAHPAANEVLVLRLDGAIGHGDGRGMPKQNPFPRRVATRSDGPTA